MSLPSTGFGAGIGSGWPQKGSELNWYGGIQALQSAVERLSKYLGTLEEKMEALEIKF